MKKAYCDQCGEDVAEGDGFVNGVWTVDIGKDWKETNNLFKTIEKSFVVNTEMFDPDKMSLALYNRHWGVIRADLCFECLCKILEYSSPTII